MNNTDELKRFMLYRSDKPKIDKLTDEQAGKLIKAIYHYAEYGEIPEVEDSAVWMALLFICQQIEADAEKYNVCRKR